MIYSEKSLDKFIRDIRGSRRATSTSLYDPPSNDITFPRETIQLEARSSRSVALNNAQETPRNKV